MKKGKNIYDSLGFTKFASQIWQICWINYKKLNQHNKTNYYNLNGLTNLFEIIYANFP